VFQSNGSSEQVSLARNAFLTAEAVVKGKTPSQLSQVQAAVPFPEPSQRVLDAYYEGLDKKTRMKIWWEKPKNITKSHYLAAWKWRDENRFALQDNELVNAYDNYVHGSTPDLAREEILQRANLGERLTRRNLEDIVTRYTHQPTVHQYVHMAQQAKSDASQSLGVNQYAQTDVGEIFSTYSIDSEAKGRDASRLPNNHLNPFNPQHAASRTLDAIGMQLNAAKIERGVWNEHHGAVVARSGTDVVTLENYNRNAEDDTLLLKEHQLRYASIRNRDYVTATQAIEDLKALQVKVELTGESIAQRKLERWFFQMYGQRQGQSFHEVWKETGFTNPVTLRRGKAVSEQKKAEVTGWLDEKIQDVDAASPLKLALQELKQRLLGAATAAAVQRIKVLAQRAIDGA